MMNLTTLETMESSDASLVAETLTGDREAFSQIVARYQTLICSLTYNRTGSLSQSEDLAQETFLVAWKQLRQLREPHKLRSWLCQIARNLSRGALRQQRKEPSHAAQPLEDVAELHSPEPLPAEQAMSAEEQALLWRSIERIPEVYREPLILFYRGNQSVRAVADQLELSEEAVKQRLSRGRKLLQEQLLGFVEGALARTNPGKAFTLALLAAIPAFTMSAKAAAIGASAAKGSATAKAAGAMGFFGAIIGPLLAIFGNYSSYRMSMDEARSDEERGKIKTLFQKSLLLSLIISAILAVPLYRACRHLNYISLFFGLLFCQTMIIYFLTIFAFAFLSLPARRRYLTRILMAEYDSCFPPAAYEYRSRLSLFGLPIVHIRIGDRFDVVRGPVKAWIAIGSSHAVGVLFASGGIAIAPLSFGGIAIGLLPLGAIAMGIFPFGACSFGVWSYGALAVGGQAFGGCAVAWNAAMAGIALAHDFALGGIARASKICFSDAQSAFPIMGSQ
jgi:RNA polymerase sigma factor (sigma-70 family)